MKRSGPPERRTPLKRKPPVRADPIAVDRWRRAAYMRSLDAEGVSRCAVTGARISWRFDDVHHPVERAELKRRGLDEWDPRNGVFVTRRVHERHTLAFERIPLAALPQCVHEYAAELGGWAVEHLRRYHR